MKELMMKSIDQENSQKDTPINRTNRLKKYRDARKLKGTCSSENNTQECKVVTREEKMEVKKLRNREAAQRARDKAKDKLENLELQLQTLKTEILTLRKRQFVCIRCGESSSFIKQIEENRKTQISQERFFQEQHIEQLQPFIDLERIKTNHHFSFPMFLMVITVILCVVGSTNNLTETQLQTPIRRPHRLLQELVNISEQDGFKNMKDKVYPHKQHPISKLKDQDCSGIQGQLFKKNQIVQTNNNKQAMAQKNYDASMARNEEMAFSNSQNSKKVIQNFNLLDYDVLFCDSSRIYRYSNNQSQFTNPFRLMVRMPLQQKVMADLQSANLSNNASQKFHSIVVKVVGYKYSNQSI